MPSLPPIRKHDRYERDLQRKLAALEEHVEVQRVLIGEDSEPLPEPTVAEPVLLTEAEMAELRELFGVPPLGTMDTSQTELPPGETIPEGIIDPSEVEPSDKFFLREIMRDPEG